MIVKKYVVNDIKEAFEKIRVELGKDAVILSTRKVKKGGFLGIGAKTYIEVTAAVEDKKVQQSDEKGQIYKLQEILSKNRQDTQSTDDLNELKKMMVELKSMISVQKSNEPQWTQDFRRALQRQDIDESIEDKLVEYARMKYQELDFSNDNTRLILSEMFLPFINTSVPELKGRVLFAGPTGVGKTTTIAKIAID